MTVVASVYTNPENAIDLGPPGKERDIESGCRDDKETLSTVPNRASGAESLQNLTFRR